MQRVCCFRVFFSYSIPLLHHLCLLIPLPCFSPSFPLLTSPYLPLISNSFLPELSTSWVAGAGGMALPTIEAGWQLTQSGSVFTGLNCSLLWPVQTEQFSHCLDQGHSRSCSHCTIVKTTLDYLLRHPLPLATREGWGTKHLPIAALNST